MISSTLLVELYKFAWEVMTTPQRFWLEIAAAYGLLLYDILNLTRTNIQQKETGAEYTANTRKGSRSRDPAPVNRSIPQPSEKNNNNFSLATDSTGKALTEQQKDFFKDSKSCQRNVCYGLFCKRKRRTRICGNYYG